MNPALHAHPERSAQRRTVGAHGEALAAAYLAERGYEILDRNWRCRLGELDLVVETGRTLVAVEVKTRRGTGCGTPLSAVTPQKAARLRLLVGEWLGAHRDGGGLSDRFEAIRIDAIGILLSAGSVPRIDHLRGIV